ncbi:MAG: putative colanic acid biosynthesis acetyltransferase [Rhizobiales bacterium]|nr:putative colanic acid biosynthesis acetyltransferase [Hyphomicrobiales bacterium]
MSDRDILDASRVDTWRGGSSFTLANLLHRTAFRITWLLLARWTLPKWHGWRRMILRGFGATIAPTAGIYPSARIWSPANLEVGDYAFIGPDVTVYSMGRIVLEPYALVSQGAYICAGTHDIEDVNFQLRSAPIRIEARAWVAAQAFVGPGVTVGRGAVLGARSFAFKNLEPWTVYVGNPAKAIKPRNVRFPDCPN